MVGSGSLIFKPIFRNNWPVPDPPTSPHIPHASGLIAIFRGGWSRPPKEPNARNTRSLRSKRSKPWLDIQPFQNLDPGPMSHKGDEISPLMRSAQVFPSRAASLLLTPVDYNIFKYASTGPDGPLWSRLGDCLRICMLRALRRSFHVLSSRLASQTFQSIHCLWKYCKWRQEQRLHA